MEPKFTPENIIADTASRNPDMPKNISKMTQVQTNQPGSTGTIKPDVMPLYDPEVARRKISAIYGNTLSPKSVDELVASVSMNNESGAKAKEFLNNSPYYADVNQRGMLLDTMLKPRAEEFVGKQKELEGNEDFNYYQKNAGSYAYANDRLAQLADIDQKYGTTDQEAEEYALLSQKKSAMDADEKFLKGRSIQEEIGAIQGEKEGLLGVVNEFNNNDAEKRELTLAGNDFQNSMNKQFEDYPILKQPLDFTKNLWYGFRGMSAGTSAFIMKKMGDDEKAASIMSQYQIDKTRYTESDPNKKEYMDVVAEGLGGALFMASFGGGLGRVGQAIGVGQKTATGAGTFISGFIPTHYQYYMDEVAKGKSAAEATDIADFRSFVTGISELIMPDVNILRGVPGKIGTLSSKLGKLMDSNPIDEILSKDNWKALGGELKRTAVESISEIAEEVFDMAGQEFISSVTDVNHKTDWTQLKKDALEMMTVTPAITVLLGGKAKYNRVVGNNDGLTAALLTSTATPEGYTKSLDAVKKAFDAGTITEQKAQELNQRIEGYHKAQSSINMNEATRAHLYNVATNGTASDIKTANELLYKASVADENDLPQIAALYNYKVAEMSKKIEDSKKKGTVKSVFFTEEEQKKAENSTAETLLNNIPVEQQADVLKEVQTIETAKTRISEIQKQKDANDNNIAIIDSQLGIESNANDPEIKSVLEQQKSDYLKENKALLDEETIINKELPVLEEKAKIAEETEKAKNENVQLITEKTGQNKVETSTEAKPAQPTPIETKPLGEQEKELATKRDQVVNAEESGIYEKAIADGTMTAPDVAAKYQEVNLPVPPKYGQDQNKGQGERQVLSTAQEESKVGESIPQPTAKPVVKTKTPFLQEKEKREAKMKASVSEVLAANPEATPAEITKKILAKHEDEIKNSAHPAKTKGMIEDSLKSELRQRNLASKRVRSFASKKSSPKKEKVINDFGKIQKALDEVNATLAPIPEKEKTPGQQPATTDGFLKIIAKLENEIKRNPIYYGSFNDPNMQSYNKEIAHTINSLVMAAESELKTLMASSSKELERDGVNNIDMLEMQLKAAIFNTLAQKVQQEFGIVLSPTMEMIPVENYEAKTEKEINQAINNYVVSIAENLSKVSRDPNADFKLEYYNRAQSIANAEIKAPTFMKKAQVVLNQIANGETRDDVILEELEAVEAIVSRDTIPNSENVPEAALVNAFYNAISKILSEQHNINSSHNVNQIVGLMFDAFDNPYEMIAFAKKVETGQAGNVDNIAKTVYSETGKLMASFIDRMMGENQLNSTDIIYISNQIRQIFENRPVLHDQFTSEGSYYSLNGGNAQLAQKGELARSLGEAKRIILNDPELKAEYIAAWEAAEANAIDAWDSILRIFDIFNSLDSNDGALVGLIKDVFNIEKLQKLSEVMAKDEDSTRIFNTFLIDLFSPIQEDINDPKFNMLSLFINDFLSKKLNGGTFVPQRKIFVDNGRSQNTISRPNTISSFTNKINKLVKKIETAEGENIWDEVRKLIGPASPMWKFVSGTMGKANKYNPYFTIRKLMETIGERELHSMIANKDGKDVGSYQKIKNANKEQRILAGVYAFLESFTKNYQTFAVPFLPSNKPKMRMYNVGRFERSGQNYVYGETVIAGSQEGLFEQYIGEIIGDIKKPINKIQAWLPRFFVVSNNGTKNEVNLNWGLLNTEAKKIFKAYLDAKLKSYVNLTERTSFGEGKNVLTVIKMHKRIMNDLLSDPNKTAAKALQWVKRLEKSGTAEAMALPKSYITFLKAIAKDKAVEGGIEFFEDYALNTGVNQQFVNNTFINTIDSFINSDVEPSFLFDRVNSFITPGYINHLGRNVIYETMKFSVEPDSPTKITISDEDGNEKIVVLTPKWLDGVEFISPQYAAESTIAVGPWSKIVGNQKAASSGVNNIGGHVFHKNMSVVLTKKMVGANPVLRPIYDRMIKHGLDKIVTTDGTKSAAEIQNAGKALIKNGNTTFEGDPKIMEFSSESTVIQQPVNLTQQDANGTSRENKMATQLLDQIYIFANGRDKALELIGHAAKALEANQRIASIYIGEFSNLINSLKRISFADPNIPENAQANENIGAERGIILDKLEKLFTEYTDNMKALSGKEATAKFTKIVDKLKQATTDPSYPTYSFEADIKGIHELFNDVVRDSQSVWVTGGWHSMVSEITGSKRKLAFANDQNEFVGEVVLSPQSAADLKLKDGDLVLAQKLPFHNMATKLFAKVIINDSVTGSSIAMPMEWVTLTGSDFDADSAGSLKIDRNYIQSFQDRLDKISDGLAQLSVDEAISKLRGDKIRQASYLKAKSIYEAQALLNKMYDIHTTDKSAGMMQTREVTTAFWEKAAARLGFTTKSKSGQLDVTSIVDQANRAESIKGSATGIGIDASAGNTLLRMGFTGTSLPNGNNVTITENGNDLKIGSSNEQGTKLKKDGSSMIDSLSNFLQIMVDSFKHNFAELLGLNEQNLLHALLLNQSGLSEEATLTLINQPIFKLYSELMKNSNNQLLPNYERSSNALYYIREMLMETIIDKKANQLLLSKLGYNQDSKYKYEGVNKIKYNIDMAKIKDAYPGLNITNVQESVEQLQEQLSGMSVEMLEGQVETYMAIAGMRSMTKTLQDWIYIRKKFQEGFTDPNEIGRLFTQMTNMGMITPDGQDFVEESKGGDSENRFVHSVMSPEQVEIVENEIAKYDMLLSNLPNWNNSGVAGMYNAYFDQGFDVQSLKEMLKYKLRMLKATRVRTNGIERHVNTFYSADPFFKQQVDGFLMGVSQGSSVIPINRQGRQESTTKEISRIAGPRQAVRISYDANDAALVEKAKRTLAERIFKDYNPNTLSEKMADFVASMDSVLKTFYKYAANFPNNLFLENLESISAGEAPAVGTRKGKPIYNSNFFLWNQHIRETVNPSEVKDMEEMLTPLTDSLGITNQIESLVANTDMSISDKFQEFDAIISGISPAQTEALGLNKQTFDFLVNLDFASKNDTRSYPMDFVMYQGSIYDAVTGYPLFGSEKNKGMASEQEIESLELVDSDNEELINAQINFDTLRHLIGMEDWSGGDIAMTYMGMVHNIIDGTGKQKQLSPMYRKGQESRVQLSINRQVGVLNFEEIKASLDRLGNEIYNSILARREGEQGLAESDLATEIGSSDMADLIKDGIRSGLFGDFYALYFAEVANGYDAWSHIKSIMQKETAQHIHNVHTAYINNEKSSLEIESLVFKKPKYTQPISWETVQSMTIGDSRTKEFMDYVHTIDPEGNLILFKKITLIGEGVNRFGIKKQGELTEEEKRLSKKSPLTYMFFPVGFYGVDHVNHYISLSDSPASALDVLSQIDVSQLSTKNILKIISGLVAANRIDQGDKTFNMMELQEALRGLVSEEAAMSPEAIVKRIDNDSKLKMAIKDAVGVRNLIPVLNAIKKIGTLAKNVLYNSNSTKLFQNVFMAESSPDEPNLTEPVSPTNVKLALRDGKTGLRMAKKNRTSMRQNVNGALKANTGTGETEYRLGDYFASRNNGKMPTTFKEAITSVMQEIKADPAFNALAKLLIGKIGNAKVVFLDKTAYEAEEAALGRNPGETNMIYNASNDTVYLPADAMFNYVDHPEALLHEGVHSLTIDLYDNDPAFKQGIDNITNQFKSEWARLSTSPSKEFQDWLAANPNEASRINDEVVNQTDPDGASIEFLAYALSSKGARMFQLLNIMDSGNYTLPASAPRTLWARLMFQIAKGLGITARDKGLYKDLMSMMSTYYDKMGATAVASAQTAGLNGSHVNINGEILATTDYIVESYLVSQPLNFWEKFNSYFEGRFGYAPKDADFLRFKREKNEIEAIKTLMYKAKTNPAVQATLNVLVSIASPRAKAFYTSFQNAISGEYDGIGEFVAANDLRLAGFVDGFYYMEDPNGLEPDQLVIDSTHVASYGDYEMAMEASIRSQNIVGGNLTGLRMPPPSLALMKAGLAAYIKESAGEKVGLLRIISVDANGGSAISSVPYSLIRNDIHVMMDLWHSANVGTAESLNVDKSVIKEGTILSFEDASINGEAYPDPLKELFARKKVVIKNAFKGQPASQIAQIEKAYEVVVQTLMDGSYKRYNRSQLEMFNANVNMLKEFNVISNETFNFSLNEYFKLVEGIDLNDITSEVKSRIGTEKQLRDMPFYDMESFKSVLISPVQNAKFKNPIMQMFSKMNQRADELYRDAAADSIRARELWNAVLAQNGAKGVLGYIGNSIRKSANKEVAMLRKFAEMNGRGGWDFKPATHPDIALLTPIEKEYYDFVTGKVAEIMNSLYSTDRVGGNPFLAGAEFREYFSDPDPVTGQISLKTIPVPASGVKYTSVLHKVLNMFKGKKNLMHDYIISNDMKSRGLANVNFVNPKNGNLENHSVNEWAGILSGQQNFAANMAAINQKVSKGECTIPVKSWKHYSKILGLRSFEFGKDIFSNEHSPSHDLNYNFQDFLMQAHSIKAAMSATQYAESLNYLLKETLEDSTNRSNMRKYVEDFIQKKYFITEKPIQDYGEKSITKTFKAIAAYTTATALGLNFKAQFIDFLVDTTKVVTDTGQYKKRARALGVAFTVLMQSTSAEKDILSRFFSSLRNMNDIKRLFALEDENSMSNIYSGYGGMAVDMATSPIYGIYKFNSYIRAMTFIGEEFGTDELRKLLTDVKNGVEITPETKEKMNRAMDRLKASLGGITKSTSTRHDDMAITDQLKFKNWIMPAFLSKWGKVGSVVGRHQTRPVYTTMAWSAYINGSRWAEQKFNLNPTHTSKFKSIEESLKGYTPEEMENVYKAFAGNMILMLANTLYVWGKYIDDEDEEVTFEQRLRNFNEMMRHRPYDALIAMAFITSGLGAPVMALFGGFVTIDMVVGIWESLVSPMPKDLESGKYTGRAERFIYKSVPGGKLARQLNEDWFITKSEQGREERYRNEHSLEKLLKYYQPN